MPAPAIRDGARDPAAAGAARRTADPDVLAARPAGGLVEQRVLVQVDVVAQAVGG